MPTTALLFDLGEDHMLSRQDPLDSYMRDIQRYPVLSHEEQHALAVSYVETGDTKIAARLVTSNLRLVVKIVQDYKRRSTNVLDLVQEGNIGLMQAVKKYDPYKGVKLTSYAAWWIRAYCIRFTMSNLRLVKVGGTKAQRSLFFGLAKERARLSAMGIDPTVVEVAKRLGVTTEDVEMMDCKLSSFNEVSTDVPVGSTLLPLGDSLSSDCQLPDEAAANGEVFDLLREAIIEFGKSLNEQETTILRERLLSVDPTPFGTLGESWGVSKQRVEQIEWSLKRRLEAYLTERFGDARKALLS